MLNLPTHPDCDILIPLWHETLFWDITVFNFGITMLHFSPARLHFMQQCPIMPSECALTATLWLQNAVYSITSLHCDITMSSITCTMLNTWCYVSLWHQHALLRHCIALWHPRAPLWPYNAQFRPHKAQQELWANTIVSTTPGTMCVGQLDASWKPCEWRACEGRRMGSDSACSRTVPCLCLPYMKLHSFSSCS